MSRYTFVLVITWFIVLCSANSYGATVALQGDNVVYEYDTVVNGDSLLLFGTPAIVGDTVRFVPPQFRSESLNGVGIDSAAAEFIFDRIYAVDGREIGGVSYTEVGDYEITGSGSIQVELFISIVNNSNSDESLEDEQMVAANGGSTGLQAWQIDSSLMPAMAMAGSAHDIGISIRNILTANSGAPGDAAWVQKKLLLLTATPVNVPLPATAWMFLSGLGLFVTARRRLCR